MTSQSPATDRQLTITGASLLGAPLLLAGYGTVRLFDGHHGPGPGWTIGHVLLLLGVLGFAPVLLHLRGLAAELGRVRRLAANAAAAAGLLGVCAVLGQTAVDLYVGAVSADRAAMDVRYDHFQSHPGVTPLLYTVLPLFFYLGLIALTAVLALGRPRLTGLRVPVLVLVATVVMAAGLDLMPVGGLLLAAAFGPLGLALLTEARTPRTPRAHLTGDTPARFRPTA